MKGFHLLVFLLIKSFKFSFLQYTNLQNDDQTLLPLIILLQVLRG